MSKRKQTIIIRKTIIGRQKRPNQNRQRNNNNNNGCGSVILIFIILSFLLASCSVEPPVRVNNSITTTEASYDASATVNHSSNTRAYKIVVWADHSGSIAMSGIPRLQKNHITPLFDLIQSKGGEIVVGQIGSASKRNLARYLHKNTISFPMKKVGQNAKEHQESILRYQEKLKNLKQNNSNSLYSKSEFEKMLTPILDYKKLANSTDLSSAVELSKMIFLEDSGFQDPLKFLILITDGLDSSSHGKFPSSLPSNVEVLVVNANSKAHDLEIYKHKKMTNIENAVRYILDQ